MIFAALAVAVAASRPDFQYRSFGTECLLRVLSQPNYDRAYSHLPMAIALPLVIVIGAAVSGGAVGRFIGWLKHRFNINEVVTSIMLNYIFSYIISFLINSYFINAISRQSQAINQNASLTADMNTLVGGLRMDIRSDFTDYFRLRYWFCSCSTELGWDMS